MSDIEKSSGKAPSHESRQEQIQDPGLAGLPPDPDAHLSPEEKAAVVSLILLTSSMRRETKNTALTLAPGSQATLAPRCGSHPLGIAFHFMILVYVISELTYH
jgi:hypothetical protein